MELPTWVHSGGYVYVLEFSTGALKIGRTKNPRSRIGSHATSAGRHDVKVVRAWVSGHISDHVSAEKALLASVTSHPSWGKEWFKGASFEDVTALASARYGGASVDMGEPPGSPLEVEGQTWRAASLHLHCHRLDGAGSAAARLIWPFLAASHARVSNADLGEMTTLGDRELKRGMAALVAAGIIHRDQVGGWRRVTVPPVGPLLVPDPADMMALRGACRSHAERPITIMTMVATASTMIASEARAPVQEWRLLPGNRSDLRRFAAMADNVSWTARVRKLVKAGLFDLRGRRLWVAPPRVWGHV